jgi:glyoxylase-like metal-dependent hydrolase (beta-lactamase superfamily II)
MTRTVTTIETTSLGDRSYLVHDGEVGAVIDPQRDIDRVLDAARTAGVQITHVLETHIHNDYVTGGLALARRVGATYCVAEAERVSFDRSAIADGIVLEVGTMTIEVTATPGHTHHHLAFVVRDADPSSAAPAAVFTGGSMLYDTVGRTDLLGAADTEPLTRLQWQSVRGLLDRLPGDADVFPTHGFGSFCSSTPASDRDSGTIDDERHANIASTIDDEDTFVEQLLQGLTASPAYYAHMDPLNRAGPFEPDLSPLPRIEAHTLRQRLEHREWVVDVRDRRAFAAEHLAGSIGVELSDSFATYLGWLLPWGARLTLLGRSDEHIAEAQRALARIGIDRPSNGGVGPIEDHAGDRHLLHYRVADFAALSDRVQAEADAPPEVIDVRRDDEFRDRHIEHAHHVPLHELSDRLHHIPPGELWVHCSTGARASIAASLLEREGHHVVLIDDDLDHAPAGLLSPAP